jgi:hypothetical protein
MRNDITLKELVDKVPEDIKDMGARSTVFYLLLTHGMKDRSGDFISGANLSEESARFLIKC